MLDAVYKTVPEIYKFCHLTNQTKCESRLISSEEAQNGDPFGPLLFCITIQPSLHMLHSELVVARLYQRYHN